MVLLLLSADGTYFAAGAHTLLIQYPFYWYFSSILFLLLLLLFRVPPKTGLDIIDERCAIADVSTKQVLEIKPAYNHCAAISTLPYLRLIFEFLTKHFGSSGNRDIFFRSGENTQLLMLNNKIPKSLFEPSVGSQKLFITGTRNKLNEKSSRGSNMRDTIISGLQCCVL